MPTSDFTPHLLDEDRSTAPTPPLTPTSRFGAAMSFNGDCVAHTESSRRPQGDSGRDERRSPEESPDQHGELRDRSQPGASTAAARPSASVIVATATAGSPVPLILSLRSNHWCLEVAPGWRYRGVAMPVDLLTADHSPRGRLCDPGHWSWVDQETFDSEVPREAVCDQPTWSSGVPGEFPG